MNWGRCFVFTPKMHNNQTFYARRSYQQRVKAHGPLVFTYNFIKPVGLGGIQVYACFCYQILDWDIYAYFHFSFATFNIQIWLSLWHIEGQFIHITQIGVQVTCTLMDNKQCMKVHMEMMPDQQLYNLLVSLWLMYLYSFSHSHDTVSFFCNLP